MKNLVPRCFIPLMALLVFTSCAKKSGESTTASGLIKIRLQTDWYPQPEHGGYYQALAKGYYAAEGLDVEILPGGPNAQVMAAIATGRIEVGMTNGDDVIVAVARGSADQDDRGRNAARSAGHPVSCRASAA